MSTSTITARAVELLTMCDCGHPPGPSAFMLNGTGVGYGIDPETRRTMCYECCAETDRKRMRSTGRATLYLARRADGYHIVNWPGTLDIRPLRVESGKHNIAKTRLDAWFAFEGKRWHGVSYGENPEVLHAKRMEGKR